MRSSRGSRARRASATATTSPHPHCARPSSPIAPSWTPTCARSTSIRWTGRRSTCSTSPRSTPCDRTRRLRRCSNAGARCPGTSTRPSTDLRRGLADGRVGVAILCARVLEQLDEVQDRATEDWPLASPATEWPSIRDELHAVIDEEIRPAFDRYRALIADEIAPRARPDDQPGLSHFRAAMRHIGS